MRLIISLKNSFCLKTVSIINITILPVEQIEKAQWPFEKAHLKKYGDRNRKTNLFSLFEGFLICLQVFLSSAESGCPGFK